MKNSSVSRSQPSEGLRASGLPHDRIADLAYRFYIEGGCREGHALEDWIRAEQLLENELHAIVTELTRPQATETGSLDERRFPLARGKRSTATREEIRQQHVPPAARQSLRPAERSRQPR